MVDTDMLYMAAQSNKIAILEKKAVILEELLRESQCLLEKATFAYPYRRKADEHYDKVAKILRGKVG